MAPQLIRLESYLSSLKSWKTLMLYTNISKVFCYMENSSQKDTIHSASEKENQNPSLFGTSVCSRLSICSADGQV